MGAAGSVASTRPPGGVTSKQWKKLKTKSDVMMTCWGRCRPEGAVIPHKFEYDDETKTVYSCMICGRERTAVLAKDPAPKEQVMEEATQKPEKEIESMKEKPLKAAINKAIEEKINKIDPAQFEVEVEKIVRRVIGEMLVEVVTNNKKPSGRAKTAKT